MGTEPVEVPEADLKEQVRQVALAVDETRRILDLVAKNAPHFFPGDSHDEMTRSWEDAKPTFDEVIGALVLGSFATNSDGQLVPITQQSLKQHQLLGPVGAAKLSLFRRWKERFLRAWNTMPEQDLKSTPAREAFIEWAEVAKEVTGSIPCAWPIKELLGLFKQTVKLRLAHDSTGGH